MGNGAKTTVDGGRACGATSSGLVYVPPTIPMFDRENVPPLRSLGPSWPAAPRPYAPRHRASVVRNARGRRGLLFGWYAETEIRSTTVMEIMHRQARANLEAVEVGSDLIQGLRFHVLRPTGTWWVRVRG